MLLLFSRSSSKCSATSPVSENGLVYGSESVGALLAKDTDGDGVFDWEEGLWGTDPLKPDTDGDGESDQNQIAKMKAERVAGAEASGEISYAEEGSLTQTDKFARELFTTVVALSQAGDVDDGTVADITASLATQIQNPAQRKVFTSADLKIISDNSTQSFMNYSNDTDKIFVGKYPFDEKVADILIKFSEGEGEGDAAVLVELDPIIKNLAGMVTGMTTINIPSEIATYHLAVTNSLEKIYENLSDIRLIDSDPVLSIGAISTYSDNLEALDTSIVAELKAIMDKFQ